MAGKGPSEAGKKGGTRDPLAGMKGTGPVTTSQTISVNDTSTRGQIAGTKDKHKGTK